MPRTDAGYIAVCDTCWAFSGETYGREIEAGWSLLIHDDPDDGRPWHQCPACQLAEARRNWRALLVPIPEPTEVDRITAGGALGVVLGIVGIAVLLVVWMSRT